MRRGRRLGPSPRQAGRVSKSWRRGAIEWTGSNAAAAAGSRSGVAWMDVRGATRSASASRSRPQSSQPVSAAMILDPAASTGLQCEAAPGRVAGPASAAHGSAHTRRDADMLVIAVSTTRLTTRRRDRLT